MHGRIINAYKGIEMMYDNVFSSSSQFPLKHGRNGPRVTGYGTKTPAYGAPEVGK